jgi:hypothetical protein
MVVQQRHEFDGEIATRGERVARDITSKYCPILTRRHIELITRNGLMKIAAQYKLFKEKSYYSRCIGRFTTIYGLLCVHHIAAFVEYNLTGATLPFEDIHQHWYYQRTEGPAILFPPPPRFPFVLQPTILPPNKVITKGRPRRDDDWSTTRDPSQFEQGVRGGRLEVSLEKVVEEEVILLEEEEVQWDEEIQ